MKIFTSLHDTLHAVTDQIRSGVMRLWRSPPTTISDAQQAPEPRPRPKRLRKRRKINFRQQNNNGPIARNPEGGLLPRLPSLRFSSEDLVGVVLAASPVGPPPAAEVQRTSPPLPLEIWDAILGWGLWEDGADAQVNRHFLQTFLSLNRRSREVALRGAPLLIARMLKGDQGDVLDLAPEQVKPGSWMAIFNTLTSNAANSEFSLMNSRTPNPERLYTAITKASIRQPSSLIIKETRPYGDGHHILLSMDNIEPSLPPLFLFPRERYSPAWNRLQELFIECPISEGDGHHLLARTGCDGSLRSAALNIQSVPSRFSLGTDLPTTTCVMTCLATLDLRTSLPLSPLISRFSFPALTNLTLIPFNDGAGKATHDLNFPWHQLGRLVLRNLHTSPPELFDMLRKCRNVTVVVWSGRLSDYDSEFPSSLKLRRLEQLSIEGHASDCLTIQTMLRPSSTLRKLAISHAFPSLLPSSVPWDLEELTINCPLPEDILFDILNHFRRTLVCGRFIVDAPVQLYSGMVEVVEMQALVRLILTTDHTPDLLRDSLSFSEATQVDIIPLTPPGKKPAKAPRPHLVPLPA